MPEHHKQPYDATLKALFREQIAEMLPYLLAGATQVEELNTDILKPQPPLRADKIFKILRYGQPHILHLELETGRNSKMAYRMLSYHALLLEQYEIPVISTIIFPFETSKIESPLVERSGEETILTFHFRPLTLYSFEAQNYIDQQAICMYPLLPSMHGAHVDLLQRAIEGMAQHYQGQQLTSRLLWFQTLLERVKTISEEDKLLVERMIYMFDELLEDNPYVKEREIHTYQQAVLSVLEGRFPNLVEQVRPKIAQIQKPDVLNRLIVQLSVASDENMARQAIETLAAV